MNKQADIKLIVRQKAKVLQIIDVKVRKSKCFNVNETFYRVHFMIDGKDSFTTDWTTSGLGYALEGCDVDGVLFKDVNESGKQRLKRLKTQIRGGYFWRRKSGVYYENI